jgi:hypothetical protein
VRATCARRGLHDLVIAAKRRRGPNQRRGGDPDTLGLGLRWTVERSNSWLANFGQLRRNTDRRSIHRRAQIALAVALILTVKLVKWADRWSPPTPAA